jgi:hypothetical protein
MVPMVRRGDTKVSYAESETWSTGWTDIKITESAYIQSPRRKAFLGLGGLLERVKPGVEELYCTPGLGERRDRDREGQRDFIYLES